ncbi:MAG: putative 3-methyladenine DNA glycosylase [Pirellulaceae bacterium]|nr:MAG: putative 3-methyladenine DNA glycosylase [Pirellulaceae bacterium]
MNGTVLDRAFYDRPVVRVAQELLGKRLVRDWQGQRVSGLIVEAEAYLAAGDPASHSYRGPTRRNRSMFGPPGHAYVYTIHTRYCLNVVCESQGVGAAVLIRAVEPEEGMELMARWRSRSNPLDWTRGPGRLCEAFQLNLQWDGWDLTTGHGLWIEQGPALPEWTLGVSPRIGIRLAQELPLRFFVQGHCFVSGTRRLNGHTQAGFAWLQQLPVGASRRKAVMNFPKPQSPRQSKLDN